MAYPSRSFPERCGYDDEIEESGNTFDENAMLKARAVFSHTGGMVLADDSGLEIDFLNGAPGIYTARFAGEHTSQEEKNIRISALLSGVASPYRSARFICSIAFVSKDKSFTVNGVTEGLIAEKPVGFAGFGYDPVFFMPEYGKTMAELLIPLRIRSATGQGHCRSFGKNWKNITQNELRQEARL